MARLFEELDFRDTPIGELSLRRRHEPHVGHDIFEIKLDDEFLMSSLVAHSEIALAKLGLDAIAGDHLDVAVGGLGLGYTAKAVLDEPRAHSLLVIDYLDAVIDWHKSGLLPLGPELTSNPRCTLSQGDFFARAASDEGLDPTTPRRKFDAILVDIDHSPDALLDDRSRNFYTPEGFANLARHLTPGGIFGLWSDARPSQEIVERLATVFAEAWSKAVTFNVPTRADPVTQTVYLARK